MATNVADKGTSLGVDRVDRGRRADEFRVEEGGGRSGSGKTLAYWACTGLVAFFIGSGGLAYALAVPDVVQGVVALGFPVYFIRLLGVWKVLGGLAVLAPGLPRLKEWAYFGIFLDLTGAAVASAVMGASIGAEWWHVAAPLAIVGLLAGSWALRPASRRLAGPVL